MRKYVSLIKEYFKKRRIEKMLNRKGFMNTAPKMTIEERLLIFKKDLVATLDANKKIHLLITVPDIAVRDYYLADPAFANFYSTRVSFREKKLKNNKNFFMLVETI